MTMSRDPIPTCDEVQSVLGARRAEKQAACDHKFPFGPSCYKCGWTLTAIVAPIEATAHVIRVEGDEVTFVWDDALAASLRPILADDFIVIRVSDVEFDASAGGWFADMTKAGADVKLGPFTDRAAALAEERRWLREHRGL